MRSGRHEDLCDVAIIGGGLAGAMAALMLERRGLHTIVLESRPEGKEQKVVVGEALTEGTSVFLRHEIGMGDWLRGNAFRKFGFDFITRPRGDKLPESIDECHELLLSLTQFEKIPQALSNLIPTFHVERTGMNDHAGEMARTAGARWLWGASVERVVLGEPHRVHYSCAGPLAAGQGAERSGIMQPRQLECRWVLDCSGRRAVLGRQLGCVRPVKELDTAAVWNRFENVSTEGWKTFHGVDRRRHTIHFTGEGFWIWWIHQNDKLTSVGVSYDKAQHQPNVKTEDHGFWEMMAKHPPAMRALEGARPLEPYQYYAHLPYRSDKWISSERWALIGDAAWFTDALYSIGIETACRQLAAAIPLVVDDCMGKPAAPRTIRRWNHEFDNCARSVLALNTFKYKHAWHQPHVLMQTALYELGEIAELYNLQDRSKWMPRVLQKHYRLQWNSKARMRKLQRFMTTSLKDARRDSDGRILKKALLPGQWVYLATWPLWNVRGLTPLFFNIVRAWAYSERAAQRWQWWPDALSWMAGDAPIMKRVIDAQRRSARG